MKNYILEYNKKIQRGEIVACESIKRIYNHLAWKVNNPGEDGFFYDEKRGQHIITFFETFLRHSKGKWGGKKIKLELWQKALFNAAYGFIDDDGFRQYQRVILIIGKKNGKSLMGSGVGLYHLMADGESGAEIYSVATTRDQAKIVWAESKRMRNKSPSIKNRTRSTISEIAFDSMDGVYKPVASNSDTLDGLNVSCALMDEFHQWKNGRALYDIIADGVTARDQPMIFMMSTSGKVREDIYDEMYDESKKIINGYDDKNLYQDVRTLPIIYELDSRKEWTNEKMWIKANPNLGVSKSIKALRDKVARAKENPSQIKNLLTKEFNIPETAGTAWLSFDSINNENKFDLEELKPRYAIGGVDLSKTTDLTAAVILFRLPNDDNIYYEAMFWIPSDLVYKKIKEDKIPYDKWIDQGWVRTCEGNSINYKDVVDWFVEIYKEKDIYLYKIGVDGWSANYFIDDLKSNFGENTVISVRQGKKTLSAPMLQLGADLEAHKVIYNNNPVLKWNMTNVAIDIDKNGNIQPVKTNQRQRIDGFAAMLDAYVVYEDNKENYLAII